MGFEKWSDEIGGVIGKGSCLIAEGWVDFRFRLKLPQLSVVTPYALPSLRLLYILLIIYYNIHVNSNAMFWLVDIG